MSTPARPSFATYDDFSNPGGGIRSSYRSSQQFQSSSDLLKTELEDLTPPLVGSEWTPEEARAEKQRKGNERKQRVSGVFTRKRNAVREWWSDGHKAHITLGVGFAFCVMLAFVLYFTIPRSPGIAYVSLTSTDSNPLSSSGYANFSWNANITLQLDARATYLPLQISKLSLSISDLNSGSVIATGTKASFKAPARKLSNVTVPILFKGQYSDASDETYADMADACGPEYTNVQRGTLALVVAADFNIVGLIGTKGAKTQADDITCPVVFTSS
ncbi:hypothetical protein MNV49_003591 [Pseudohyphozyma bogoriensis]|nr:hypothetical protein MNV49_003591 [Pseudohyphozyma bogoriensis]